MGVYIKNWSLTDWKELLKWAKIGANNAMIGEFAEVEELPPHGRLIDADVLMNKINNARLLQPEIEDVYVDDYIIVGDWLRSAPTVIEAEGESNDGTKN